MLTTTLYRAPAPATYRRFESEGLFGRHINDDGRFYGRMGCDVGPQVSQRCLVQEGDGSPYKPSGITGGPEGSSEFYLNIEEQSSDHVHLDNVTAAAYLMKEGGTRSRAVNESTKEILLYCKRHKVMIAPAYLPGVANLGADDLSRGTKSREWFLDPALASRVFRHLGEPEVDLFASNRSAQVERYFMLDWKDKRATWINALEREWDFKLMYAFPPPQLIPRILDRMNEHRGTLILITPSWTRVAWLPELIQMSMKQPLRLPLQQSTVSDLSTGSDLPSLSKFRLTVWTICGNLPGAGSRSDFGGVHLRILEGIHEVPVCLRMENMVGVVWRIRCT